MNKKYTYVIIIFLIVVSFAAFGRIAGNDFINFDDPAYVSENHYIQSGINPDSIQWAITTTYFSYWHPLTWLSHMLDWNLFGANASGHHLVSLLLHIGAVIFLFLFLNKTTGNFWPSAFAAAFFALHPLRVESVAWASERKDVLSMFFGMACLYSYAFYAELPRLSRYLLCLILFACALMSKPMMVTLPFVMMLLDYWPLNRWQKAFNESKENRFKALIKLVWEKVHFIFLTIAVSVLTFWAQNIDQQIASIKQLPFFERVANATISYTFYLGKTFWPDRLAVFYPYDFSLPLWKVLISGFILVMMTLAVIYFIKKMPFLFAGWFWYLGTLVPVIGLVQVGNQAMADRYTYLPSIGIAIMLSWGSYSLIKDESIRKKILFPAAITVLFFLAFLTWQQCGYWKNSVALFSHALQVTENNYLAYDSRGIAYGESGAYLYAIYDFSKAIELKPTYFKAYNNRGFAYTKIGQDQSAINDYSKAIFLKPDYAKAYNNRAIAYLNQGNKVLGCSDAQKSCSLGLCATLDDTKSKGFCN